MKKETKQNIKAIKVKKEKTFSLLTIKVSVPITLQINKSMNYYE